MPKAIKQMTWDELADERAYLRARLEEVGYAPTNPEKLHRLDAVEERMDELFEEHHDLPESVLPFHEPAPGVRPHDELH
jgi:hypothetical protein